MNRPISLRSGSPEAIGSPARAALLRLTHLASATMRAKGAVAISRDGGQPPISESTGLETSALREAHDALLGLGRRVVVRDVRELRDGPERKVAELLGARALLSAPFFEPSRSRTGIVLVHDSVPREWAPDDVGLIEELAHGALSRWALLEEIEARERREAELRLLQSLTEAIFAAPNVASAIWTVLHEICEFTGWKYGEAWLPDAQGERLVPAQSWFAADDDHFLERSRDFSFERGVGLPGRVWELRRPIWEQDLSTAASYLRTELAAASGVSAGVGIPVIFDGVVTAVLVFHASSLGEEDHRLTQLISTVASQLGGVIRAKRADDARREADRRLRAVFDATFQFIGLLSPDGILLDVNQTALRFAGVDRKSVLGRPFAETPWWSRNASKELLEAGIRRAAAGEVVRFEAVHEVGSDKVVVDFSLSPVRDETGEVAFLIPEGRDVTERKRAERALQAAQQHLLSIIADAADGIVELDLEGNVILANPAALAMLERSTDEIYGRSFFELVHHSRADGSPLAVADAPLSMAIREDITVRTDEHVFWRGDGSSFPVEYSCTLHGDLDERKGVVLTFRDISERKRSEVALQDLALRDELTGLHNRRGFMLIGRQGLKIARRSDERVMLLYMDLDEFKKINDTLGHPVGDEALIDVSTLLRKTFRDSDAIARLGGDEFTVLAMCSASDSEESIRGRLDAAIAKHNAEAGRPYRLSLSIGTSYYDNRRDPTLDEMMAEADAALLREKRAKKTARAG
ncbi:MAG TPA: diguanylate cyclase [Vulgatibacter sp.]|nr:diguanylate cyclase [Vulgatibacter sp.]